VTAHAAALAALRDWSPPTPEQAGLRRRYVSHLAELLDNEGGSEGGPATP